MPALPRARRRPQARGKLRGIGMSCYIEACGIAPSAAVGSLGAGVGLWESAEVRVNRGRHDRGADRLAQPRPGPRDDLRAARSTERFGVPIDSVSIVHGDTDKVQMGMGTYGSRSGAVGMSADRQGARQGRGQGQEDRRPSAGGRRGRHRHRERRAEGRRHRQEAAVVPGGARRLHRAQSARRHGAGAEGEARSTIRPTSPSRPAATSARSRSTPTPARPRSSSSSPPTISATSSTR